MCGISGVLAFNHGGLYAKDFDSFFQLHKVMALRGADGAGMFWVGDKKSGAGHLIPKDQAEDNYVSWVKIDGTPYDLYGCNAFIDRKGEIEKSRFVVGHCRFATKGATTSNNAHPFQTKHITLVHNGMIREAPVKNMHKYPVDSMALCDALAKGEAKHILKEVTGDIAAVWYNAKECTINMFRNYARPLKMYKHPGFDTVSFASEGLALLWILRRLELMPRGEIEDVPVNTLLTWNHKGDLNKTLIEKSGYQQQRGFGPGWLTDDHSYPPPKSLGAVEVHRPKWVPPDSPKEAAAPRILAPVTTLSPIATENKPKKFKPRDSYGGLRKGDMLTFDLANQQIIDRGQPAALIEALFVGTPAKGANLELLSHVTVSATIRRNTMPQLINTLNNTFFQGRVVSIVSDENDLSDVKVYIENPAPVGTVFMKEQIEKGYILPEYAKDFNDVPLVIQSATVH